MTVSVEKPTGVLKAHDIWVGYSDGADILKGVSIDISPGHITMILGRSGSGKTTLLRTLANILEPSKGLVENTSGVHIAYIPQSLGLVRGMTALENTLTGSLKDVPKFPSLFKSFPPAVTALARKTLTGLGIGHKFDEQVHHLSGGERQRVAIARALMQKPQIILADEFVSQLDEITTHEILSMTKDLAGSGISFLITTHDIGLVKQYADRVVIMGHGRVLVNAPTNCLDVEQMTGLLK